MGSADGELDAIALDPVKLCLPPTDVSNPALLAQPLDVSRDRAGDRLDDVDVLGDAVGVAEKRDPPRLLASGWPVGAEVQPEKQRVAEVVAAGAGRCAIEVDDRDRRASRKTKLHGERSLWQTTSAPLAEVERAVASW